MKKLLIIAILCSVTACSGTGFKYTNKDARKSVSLHNEKVSVSKVNLNLIEERITGKSSADNAGSQYLNTAQMGDLLKNSITSGLKDEGVYGNDANYNAEVSVDAARSYLAFSKDAYAGLNVKEVGIKIFKDGNLFAEKSLKGQINCGHNRGFASNLGNIAKTVTAQKDNSEEIEDVKYCGVSIARTIGELGN